MSKRGYSTVTTSGLIIPAARRLIRRRVGDRTIRGRVARLRGAVSRGYTRRAGYYGRFGLGAVKEGMAELKFFDTTYDDAFVDTGGGLQTSINLIPQGITESTRIGRKCTLKHIEWRYRINLPERLAQAAPQPSGTIRMIMYQDMQCNGGAATAALIMQQITPTGFFNVEEQARYKIFMDRTITLSALTNVSDAANVIESSRVEKFGVFRKYCHIPIEFDASASDGSLGTIRSNNVGCLCIAGGSAVAINLESKIRVRFSDM